MTKIIIQTDDPKIVIQEHRIRYILMDALYEFVSHRGPSAEEYVSKRYPNTLEYAWLDRPAKIADVNKRKMLAQQLHGARIEFVIVPPELDTEE